MARAGGWYLLLACRARTHARTHARSLRTCCSVYVLTCMVALRVRACKYTGLNPPYRIRVHDLATSISAYRDPCGSNTEPMHTHTTPSVLRLGSSKAATRAESTSACEANAKTTSEGQVCCQQHKSPRCPWPTCSQSCIGGRARQSAGPARPAGGPATLGIAGTGRRICIGGAAWSARNGRRLCARACSRLSHARTHKGTRANTCPRTHHTNTYTQPT